MHAEDERDHDGTVASPGGRNAGAGLQEQAEASGDQRAGTAAAVEATALGRLRADTRKKGGTPPRLKNVGWSACSDNGGDSRRMLVVGLDCAAPELVFGAWRGDLPTLNRLMTDGAWGSLESTIPAITVPAWSCMMSGLDPGQLGFYGFRNRADHSYGALTIANASAMRAPRVWDMLSDAGRRVAAVGVPQTYPVGPVNGHMVSCFLTPGAKSEFTHPPELREEIAEWVDGEFLMDVPAFRSDDKERILDDIYRLAEQHFTVCARLLERERYDYFMTVDMGVDRIHHAFWRYMDPAHPKHEPGSPFEHAIHDYYVFVDGKVAELIDRVDDDTVVVVVSDHGAKPIMGGLCVNEWLMREGYLTLKQRPSRVARLDECEVDWSRTKAWGEGGYYGRIFLNVAGREPEGVIRPEDYEAERLTLIDKLEAITDPAGRNIGTAAFRPEDIYAVVNGVAPDLIVYFGDLGWRSVGSVGLDSIWTFENDTGPDDANHAQRGIFIAHDPRSPAGGRELSDLTIYDVAPTILTLLGYQPPAGLRGQPIEIGAETRDGDDRLSASPVAVGSSAAYSDEEEQEVTARLRDLGYL
jgi:predicted AlkP superfamily phosphohydrolase/phosphomutase